MLRAALGAGLVWLATRLDGDGQLGESAATSVNAAQVPAVFRRLPLRRGLVNADMGGGRYDTATALLRQHGATNLVYDPFNRTPAHNDRIMKRLLRSKADTATVANVLNVIQAKATRQAVLEQTREVLKPNGTAYIWVHEGDGSGKGAPTTKGYQANRKTASYEREVRAVFPRVERRGRLILARP
jgi:hypothetical protein